MTREVEVLVIHRVGQMKLMSVEGEWAMGRGYIPPRTLKIHHSNFTSIRQYAKDNGGRLPEPGEYLFIDILNLPAHRMKGLPVQYAYWPETWLDEWGVKECCAFFSYPYEPETFEADYIAGEDYGSQAQAYSDAVEKADALDVRLSDFMVRNSHVYLSRESQANGRSRSSVGKQVQGRRELPALEAKVSESESKSRE